MSQADPFTSTMVWRRDVANPKRDPAEADVQDGRAEYVLSGPYHMAEGSKVEVLDGQLLFTGSNRRVS
ncbi:hypothetical protein J2X84_004530 [Pseudomonas corrugata]|uniref:hypothetical protein n=1 Tax=Pseudomonas corrugata TaxID=47879 RepID=UPI002858F3AC|nr:hypothetical protein [Pseudomonas corrugata]MDR7285680.1 hypothetical protein [Pseudomonas corrugata]